MSKARIVRNLPPEIQADVDILDPAVCQGTVDVAAFLRLTRWLAKHAREVLQAPSDWTLPALNPEPVKEAIDAPDEDVAFMLELEDDVDVLPTHRLEYLPTHALPRLFQDWIVSSLFAPLYLNTSRHTLLGCWFPT